MTHPSPCGWNFAVSLSAGGVTFCKIDQNLNDTNQALSVIRTDRKDENSEDDWVESSENGTGVGRWLELH